MNSQSIVKRINQLKKVSVQLKQSTEDPNSNHDLIRGILQLGRLILPMQNQAHYEQSQFGNKTKNKSQFGNNKKEEIQNQYNFRVFQNGAKNQNNYFYDHSSHALQSSFLTNKTWNQLLTPTQQINFLRNQNSDLEEEINSLRDRLKKLQQIQRQQKQEQWKEGLPYFQINIPKLRIFYTKLTISQKDYDKIDYSYYSADLTLQKISLLQISQPGLSSRPPKSITLMLNQLKQVSYYNPKTNQNIPPLNNPQRSKQIESKDDQNLIVYYFKYNKETPTKSQKKTNGKRSAFSLKKNEEKPKQQPDGQVLQTLFVKFDNEEQYKQWDLGVFINCKIVEQLTKPDFRESNNNSYLSGQNSMKHNSENKSNVNYNSLPFSNLIDKLITKNNSPISNPKNQNDEEISNKDIFRKFEINSSQQKSPKDPKQNNNIKIRDQNLNADVQPERGSIEQIINKQRSNTSHFGMLTNSISINEQKVKTQAQQKMNTQQQKRQKLIQLQEQKKKENQRMQAMKRTQLQISVKRAKQSLRKGYYMIKYAKYGLNPHQKRVYLNEDGKRLCWEDIKSTGQPKYITINDILSIRQGQIGKGIEAHAKQKQIIGQKSSFVVIQLKSKDRKTLELKSKDLLAMDQFCKQLQLYRQNLNKK